MTPFRNILIQWTKQVPIYNQIMGATLVLRKIATTLRRSKCAVDFRARNKNYDDYFGNVPVQWQTANKKKVKKTTMFRLVA